MQGLMVNKTRRLLKRASTRDNLRCQRERLLLNEEAERGSSNSNYIDDIASRSHVENRTESTISLSTANKSSYNTCRPTCLSHQNRGIDLTFGSSVNVAEINSRATTVGFQIGLSLPQTGAGGNSTRIYVQLPLGMLMDKTPKPPATSVSRERDASLITEERKTTLHSNSKPTEGKGAQQQHQINRPPEGRFKLLRRARSCYIGLISPFAKTKQCVQASDSQSPKGPNVKVVPSKCESGKVNRGDDPEQAVGVQRKELDTHTHSQDHGSEQNNNNNNNNNERMHSIREDLNGQDPTTMSMKQPTVERRNESYGVTVGHRNNNKQLSDLRSQLIKSSISKGHHAAISSDSPNSIADSEDGDDYKIEIGRFTTLFKTLSSRLDDAHVDQGPPTDQTISENTSSSLSHKDLVDRPISINDVDTERNRSNTERESKLHSAMTLMEHQGNQGTSTLTTQHDLLPSTFTAEEENYTTNHRQTRKKIKDPKSRKPKKPFSSSMPPKTRHKSRFCDHFTQDKKVYKKKPAIKYQTDTSFEDESTTWEVIRSRGTLVPVKPPSSFHNPSRTRQFSSIPILPPIGDSIKKRQGEGHTKSTK